MKSSHDQKTVQNESSSDGEQKLVVFSHNKVKSQKDITSGIQLSDGRFIAVGRNGVLQVWSESGEELLTINTVRWPHDMKELGSNQILVGNDSKFILITLNDKQSPVCGYTVTPMPFAGYLAPVSDRHVAVAESYKNELAFWDVINKEKHHSCLFPEYKEIAIHRSARTEDYLIFIGVKNGLSYLVYIDIQDFLSKKDFISKEILFRNFDLHGIWPCFLIALPGNKIAYSIEDEKEIYVHDLATNQAVKTLEIDGSIIALQSVSPSCFASIDSSGKLQFWDATHFECMSKATLPLSRYGTMSYKPMIIKTSLFLGFNREYMDDYDYFDAIRLSTPEQAEVPFRLLQDQAPSMPKEIADLTLQYAGIFSPYKKQKSESNENEKEIELPKNFAKTQ